MNVEQLQKQIHVLYEGDVDFPNNIADEDFQIRLALINLAISEWAQVANVLWRELTQWLMDDTSITDHRIIADQNKYPCPDDFSKMYEGVIYIGSLKVKEFPIEKRQDKVEEEASGFYISGNKSDGFYINFLNVNLEDVVGEEINYLYIKQPKIMEKLTDKPQCSDPNYVIHRVVSELYAQDSDPKATKELGMSQDLLSSMVVNNATTSIAGDNTYQID